LYIPAHCKTVDKQWRGIGIRIEDDVLVTATGHEVLTQSVPKSIVEIEQLMQESYVAGL
jgi:Xaa-Pro aminopeptidase